MESEGCILVVDDERDIREFLVMALADEGHGVLAARSGAEALERLRQHAPRLVLLDYNLGDMTGAEVAAAYRAQPPPHAPIVVLTAAHDAARRAAEVGADHHLGKPFDLDALLDLVARHAA
jgi:two-component system, chemotaxis family, chemotaxis protein CheY